MTRTPKLWGGTYAGRERIIVKTLTKKAAIEAFVAAGYRVTETEWRHAFCESGNAVEEALTEFAPLGTVFASPRVSACRAADYDRVRLGPTAPNLPRP